MTDEWSHERHCAAAESEIARFAALIAEADPAAPVPTCPGWTVGDLVRHLGRVHRWAAAMVRDLAQRRYDGSDLSFDVPDDPASYPEWLTEGGEKLTAALRAADPDAPMWAWGADQHARFWSRRMLHETGIHRADAEFTLGREPDYTLAVALDGVDEFLVNLPKAARFAPNVANLHGDGEAIRLTGGDTSWLITLTPDVFTWRRGDGPADVTVRADPADLYLFVYGRRTRTDPRVETSGDTAVLTRWTDNASI